MVSVEQYHLKGPRHSGRAVRLKELSSSDVNENLTQAAKLVSKDASVLELRKAEYRLGIQRFVVEISDACADPLDPTVKWKKVDPASFTEGLDSFFTAKDVQILEALYREYHEVSQQSLDDIMGKAIPVSV